MSLSVLNVTNLPIYLPYDKAQLPFGDPIEGVTCTSASPGVVTAVGYAPVNGDAVSLSYTAGGSIPTGLTVGQTYYVVSASGNTFSLSATKGGSAINTSSTGSNLVLHLLSAQVDGVTLPFKPGNTVVVENNSGGQLVLQGAPDAGQAQAGTNTYNPATGPGTWVTLATVPANSVQGGVQLSYDWIRVSTSGTLSLQQT
jgi:hypothetical protein